MPVFTIGFTKTTAESFFRRLAGAGVRTVVDVRLQRTSQLAGFAKEPDLAYFLKEIDGIGYRAEPAFMPRAEDFRAWRGRKIGWDDFAARFVDLLDQRRVEDEVTPADLEGACLLCSEDRPHRCHRRLVVEYLEDRWGRPLDVRHL